MGESENQSSEWSSFLAVILVGLMGFVAWEIAHPPRFSSSRTSPANYCINNLRQLDGGKAEWALEKGKTNGTPCTIEDIKPYIKLNAKGEIPGCPMGGKYTIGKVGEPVTCSLSNAIPPHVLP